MPAARTASWTVAAPPGAVADRVADTAAWFRPRDLAAQVEAEVAGAGDGARVTVRLTGDVAPLRAVFSLAWSADCLRIWLATGQVPRVSRRRWALQLGLRLVVALAMAYHGAFGLVVPIALGIPGAILVAASALLALGVARTPLLAGFAVLLFGANLFAVLGWPTYPLLPLNWPLWNTLVFGCAGAAFLAADNAPDIHRGAGLLRRDA